jgi:hypothetical protein
MKVRKESMYRKKVSKRKYLKQQGEAALKNSSILLKN